MTLSGLLNALDGFSAPDNVLFIMTSNQVEALDPALLRPGRIDYRLYLGPATEEQKVQLYRRFFPAASMVEAELFVDSHPKEAMAGELVDVVPRAGHNPEAGSLNSKLRSGAGNCSVVRG